MTTMTSADRFVTGGVDTHRDFHVAAALDHLGGVLATAQFPTTMAGYRSLLSWLASFGTVDAVGVEGTGSYGAALARHLAQAGVRVIEVGRPGRSAAGTARPTSSTRSPPRGRCSPVMPARHRSPTTARSRRCGR